MTASLRLALAALLLAPAPALAFSAAEWSVLERETPRYARALGAAAGREAACGMTQAAASRQGELTHFVLRYLTADAEAKAIESFELAAARTGQLQCDRYLRARDLARAGEARRRIEPVLRDHHF